MREPRRAERHWLAIAVAQVWLVGVAGEYERQKPASRWQDLPKSHVARQKMGREPRPRELSDLTVGRLWMLRVIVLGEQMPEGGFEVSAWPEQVPRLTRYIPDSRRRKKKNPEQKQREGRS
jgi:hypothetical protein